MTRAETSPKGLDKNMGAPPNFWLSGYRTIVSEGFR